MSDLTHGEEIERHLKDQLEAADQRLRDAKVELVEAKRHYRKALQTFTRLVVDGIVPE